MKSLRLGQRVQSAQTTQSLLQVTAAVVASAAVYEQAGWFGVIGVVSVVAVVIVGLLVYVRRSTMHALRRHAEIEGRSHSASSNVGADSRTEGAASQLEVRFTCLATTPFFMIDDARDFPDIRRVRSLWTWLIGPRGGGLLTVSSDGITWVSRGWPFSIGVTGSVFLPWSQILRVDVGGVASKKWTGSAFGGRAWVYLFGLHTESIVFEFLGSGIALREAIEEATGDEGREVASLTERLITDLEQVPGIVTKPFVDPRGPGFVSWGPSFWRGKTEVALLLGYGVIDLRLTAPVIREKRSQLKADPRFTVRPGRKNWVTYRFRTDGDVDQAIDLIKDVIDASG